ncbi:uncharacterized protein EAE97_008433 [Botrytis byssoidea]|uniref:Uncharacterized protein n=1 Tax=Botrytis byssoidea TaxID=139641 RepID=A0A9P5M0H1_9HELO|nr:uncharacterized protein EAE97_008433 [Botrytis byssoidea]KAF7934073.1 hypothetical protein EAE97_008433 [Botrytis byssoidea]
MSTVEESFRPKGGDYPRSIQSAASSVSTMRPKSSTRRSSKSSAASSVSNPRSKSSTHRSSKSTTSRRQLTPQDPKTQTSNTLVDDYNRKRRPGAASTYGQSSSGSVASSKPSRLTRLLNGFSNGNKGSSSQHSSPRSARSSSKAPASVHASECGPVAPSFARLQRLSAASKYPIDQNAHIESWRQAVISDEHEQQALVPFEQPRNSASTIKHPKPDTRLVLFKPPAKAASCSALVSQQSSSAPLRDDHAARVARKYHAKSRSEYSQSSSGRSSGSSRATSIDGNRSERQERPRLRQSSHRSNIRTQRPPPPPPPPPPPHLPPHLPPHPSPHPPPQFQGPRAPVQAPPEPTSAQRYTQELPPFPRPELHYESRIPQSHTEHLQRPPPSWSCPPPTYLPYTILYSPEDEIAEFEREKLLTMQRLVEVNERLHVEMERHNDNVDAMLYQPPVHHPLCSFLPTCNI